MVDIAYALNNSFVFACPQCKSHSVEISWNEVTKCFKIACDECGHSEYMDLSTTTSSYMQEKWHPNIKKITKKIQQAVVRTYATANDTLYKPCQNLEKALNDGWRVLMCHRIGDRTLEYILEKEIEE